MSDQQQDELYTLLERADEIAYNEGVDSDAYNEAYQKLLDKQEEYGAYEELSDDGT